MYNYNLPNRQTDSSKYASYFCTPFKCMLCVYDLFVFRCTYLKKVLFTVMLKMFSVKTVLPPQLQSMLMHVFLYFM